MVKKKKKIKRVAVWFAVAFVLAAGVAPALLPSAGALPALPGNFGTSDEVTPDVAYLSIPLDRFTNHYQNVSIENPFYSVAVGDTTTGYSASIDIDIFGPWEKNPMTWIFWYSGSSALSDGGYLPRYSVTFTPDTNGINFSMSNSSSFVVSISDLNRFLGGSLYQVPRYYQYRSIVDIAGFYPSQADDLSWSLEPFHESLELTWTNTGSSDNYIPAFSLVSAEALDARLTYDDFIIIDEISVDFYLYCPLENISLTSTAGYQAFRLPVSYDSFTRDISEFMEKYPAHVTVVSDIPGANDFNFTAFLSSSVGAFMATEIIPGLSFGGMLAVSIGLTLVVVFFKMF